MSESPARAERQIHFKYSGMFFAGLGLIGLIFPYPWDVFVQGFVYFPLIAFLTYKRHQFSWREILVIALIAGSMWYIARNVLGFSDILIWKASMLASVIVGGVLILIGELAKKRH
jgi:hypothetical protein